MKRFYILLSAASCLLAAASCNKSDGTPQPQSAIKEGVWTNYPDRVSGDTSRREVPVRSSVVPLLMKVSGTDVQFSAYDVEKGGLNYKSGSLTYDASSNKGTITIPSIGEYGGYATFSMTGKENMVCVTQKQDTVHMVWCGQSTEGWWKTRPARDFVIPEGEGLSKDTGVGGGMMDLVQKIFGEKSPSAGGVRTKVSVVDVFDIASDCFSIVSDVLSIADLFRPQHPNNQDIMNVCNQISAQLDDVNRKLDDALVALDKISTQIDLQSLTTIINDRNTKLNIINNSFKGDSAAFVRLTSVPEEQRSEDDWWGLFNLLKGWSGSGDVMIKQTLPLTVQFLLTSQYQNGGKIKKSLPLAYDDMLLSTVAWEHEYGLGGEAMRLADMCVIVKCADWAATYLKACEHLKMPTSAGGNPSELKTVIDVQLNNMMSSYKSTNVDLTPISKRRICYIKNAHFRTDNPTLMLNNCHGMMVYNLSSPYNWIVPKPIKSEYEDDHYTNIWAAYDFYKFLGEGDPQVLASQNLVSYYLLDKVCNYYYEPGTTGYHYFYRADKIAEMMLLDFSGVGPGSPVPWLVTDTTPYAYVLPKEPEFALGYLSFGSDRGPKSIIVTERPEQGFEFRAYGYRIDGGYFVLDHFGITGPVGFPDAANVAYFTGYAY